MELGRINDGDNEDDDLERAPAYNLNTLGWTIFCSSITNYCSFGHDLNYSVCVSPWLSIVQYSQALASLLFWKVL